jgi:hypothetical protein
VNETDFFQERSVKEGIYSSVEERRKKEETAAGGSEEGRSIPISLQPRASSIVSSMHEYR